MRYYYFRLAYIPFLILIVCHDFYASLLSLKRNERYLMYFSRKNILTKGKRPLKAVSRVINASCGSASTTFARCWVHSTNKTSALFKTVKNQGFRRAYSTKSGGDGQGTGAGGLQAGLGLPFYRMTIAPFPPVRATDAGVRQNYQCLVGNAD